MMDVFLALTEHSETVRKTLIENVLPRLLEMRAAQPHDDCGLSRGPRHCHR